MMSLDLDLKSNMVKKQKWKLVNSFLGIRSFTVIPRKMNELLQLQFWGGELWHDSYNNYRINNDQTFHVLASVIHHLDGARGAEKWSLSFKQWRKLFFILINRRNLDEVGSEKWYGWVDVIRVDVYFVLRFLAVDVVQIWIIIIFRLLLLARTEDFELGRFCWRKPRAFPQFIAQLVKDIKGMTIFGWEWD